MKNTDVIQIIGQYTMHIFTYGSLMFPQIWQRVVRGSYRSAPATAHDFIRLALAGDTYPGMVGRAGEQVEGVLYFDVDAQDVAALDAFEGCEYERAEIAVKMSAGEIVIAGTYIFLARQRLSAVSWEPQAFQMSRFIGAYCRDKFGR